MDEQWSLGDLQSLPISCEQGRELPDRDLPALPGMPPREPAVVQLPGAALVSGDDGEAVREVGGALERREVDPRAAPEVVDHQ